MEEVKKDANFIFKLERNIKAYMLYTILLLALVSIGLTIALIVMMPLKKEVPYLMTFSSADSNFVKITNANLDVRSDEALLKNILAGYVKKRETINRIDDIERYQTIRIQSQKIVWNEFENIIKNPNSIYTTKNLFRKIQIINVAVLSENVATIDFQAEVSNQARTEVRYEKLRATIEFNFIEQNLNYKEALDNPTGFQISKYQISEINDKENK